MVRTKQTARAPAERKQTPDRTVVSSMGEIVEKAILDAMRYHYLPRISAHVRNGKDSSVGGLMELLNIEVKEVAPTPVKKSAPAAPAKKKAAPAAQTKNTEWPHPDDFDSEHDPNKCQYFAVRGGRPYKFCTKNPSEKGLNLFCTQCCKRSLFNVVSEQFKAGTFSMESHLEYHAQEYLKMYNKKTGNETVTSKSKSKGGKKGASFGEEILDKAPDEEEKEMEVYEYTHSDSQGWFWWPSGCLVLKLEPGDDPEQDKEIVLGYASGVSSAMRKLTPDEAKMAMDKDFEVPKSSVQTADVVQEDDDDEEDFELPADEDEEEEGSSLDNSFIDEDEGKTPEQLLEEQLTDDSEADENFEDDYEVDLDSDGEADHEDPLHDLLD